MCGWETTTCTFRDTLTEQKYKLRTRITHKSKQKIFYLILVLHEVAHRGGVVFQHVAQNPGTVLVRFHLGSHLSIKKNERSIQCVKRRLTLNRNDMIVITMKALFFNRYTKLKAHYKVGKLHVHLLARRGRLSVQVVTMTVVTIRHSKLFLGDIRVCPRIASFVSHCVYHFLFQHHRHIKHSTKGIKAIK